MVSILKHPTTGPATWNAEEIHNDQRWLKHLSPSFVSAIADALSHIRSKSLTFPDFEIEDFP